MVYTYIEYVHTALGKLREVNIGAVNAKAPR